MEVEMKAVVALLSLSFIVSCQPARPAERPAARTPAAVDPVTLARQLVDHLAAGRFTEGVASFSPELAARLTADRLKASWAEIVAEVRAFRRMASAGTVTRGGMVAVEMACEFEKGSRIVRVVYRGEVVVGLFFKVGG
jgi:hypothetical protein